MAGEVNCVGSTDMASRDGLLGMTAIAPLAATAWRRGSASWAVSAMTTSAGNPSINPV